LSKNLISPKVLSEFCEDLTASAMRFNNYAALDDLISLNMFPKNVNSYFSNDVGLTYFEYSIVYTDVKFINKLKTMGGHTNMSYFELASHGNSLEVVKFFYPQGGSLNISLLLAAENNLNVDVFSYLISLGANTEATIYGETALMHAVHFNDNAFNVIDPLILGGANVNYYYWKKDNWYDDPEYKSVLSIARRYQSDDVVNKLINAGAN
jgi:ankyrin repeat protein